MEKLYVTIGQVMVGRSGQSLNAILGSCIGIGFLFSERGIFGLAHCLLSKSNSQNSELNGRHVDTAISSLCSMMLLTPADKRKVSVFIAGGANMTRPTGTDPKRLVGSINSTFTLHAVKDSGFHIQYKDIGGNFGRKMTIDCSAGNCAISKIPRLGG